MSTPTPTTHGLATTVEREPVVRPGPEGTFGVVEALCKVMAALPNIGKDDKSPEGYAYRGIEAITRHAQGAFAEHGVLVIPQAEVLATVPSPAMKDGWQDVIMRVEWTIAAVDGSTVTAVTNGVGRDRSDKGVNKAQTQALKYLLLPLLLIADKKDDADGQTYEDGHRPESTQPTEPAITKSKLDQIMATLATFDEDTIEKLKGWVSAKKMPEHPRQLTEAQADEVIAHMATLTALDEQAKDMAAEEPFT